MTTYITRPSGLWRRIEVASRPDCPMVRYERVPFSELEYTVPLPPHFIDNIIALTEILNSRPKERQVSRDLYKDALYFEIAQAVA